VPQGVDSYGFRALPSGLREQGYTDTTIAEFHEAGSTGEFWSFFEQDAAKATTWEIYGDEIGFYEDALASKRVGRAVRCIKE
jgi:uncharacterized protein (TIGR02145 family)